MDDFPLKGSPLDSGTTKTVHFLKDLPPYEVTFIDVSDAPSSLDQLVSPDGHPIALDLEWKAFGSGSCIDVYQMCQGQRVLVIHDTKHTCPPCLHDFLGSHKSFAKGCGCDIQRLYSSYGYEMGFDIEDVEETRLKPRCESCSFEAMVLKFACEPVARHHVHEMISSHRGKKTFMLCTHLLSEAESLCDQISIMIKGCVYTCGSPQYLSQKFGTEYKIDVMLNKEDSQANEKCTSFFQNALPQAVLTILRPSVRIYSIPSNAMKLSELFTIMERGSEGDNGFGYYTCSSSSLERVFMEIVHLSENEDAVFAKEGHVDVP